MTVGIEAPSNDLVAAIAIDEKTRDPTDRRDTHTGNAMDFAVGQTFLQPLDHGPTICECLQFCRRAQVAKERAALIDGFQCENRREEAALGECFLASCDSAVLFHVCFNVLTH